MLTVALLIILPTIACVVAIAALAWRAPKGYQDDLGFHYGTDPRDHQEG